MDEWIWQHIELLMNVNYFHEDVQEKSHHELNGALEKNDYLIQTQQAALIKKVGIRGFLV